MVDIVLTKQANFFHRIDVAAIHVEITRYLISTYVT